MEVHHHAHTARKKWSHYFWEFLMLFLAVFCGFFAEYKLEHTIEHQRADKLIVSLINDLEEDVIQLNMHQVRREKRKIELDNLKILLEKKPEEIGRKEFYNLITRAQGFLLFSQSTGTLNQLKNAGYLRYFSDNKLSKFLADYEFWIQDFKGDEALETKWINEKLSDFAVFNLEYDVVENIFINNHYPRGKGIRFYRPGGMHDLKAIVHELRIDNHIMLNEQIPKLRTKALEFIKYLKKKYSLK